MLCGHEGRTIGHLGGTSWSPISLLGTFVSVVSSIVFLSFTCRIASPRGRGARGGGGTRGPRLSDAQYAWK